MRPPNSNQGSWIHHWHVYTGSVNIFVWCLVVNVNNHNVNFSSSIMFKHHDPGMFTLTSVTRHLIYRQDHKIRNVYFKMDRLVSNNVWTAWINFLLLLQTHLCFIKTIYQCRDYTQEISLQIPLTKIGCCECKYDLLADSRSTSYFNRIKHFAPEPEQ